MSTRTQLEPGRKSHLAAARAAQGNAASMARSLEIQQTNAIAYLASLFDGRDSPVARYPEPYPSPTGLVDVKFNINIPAVTQATSGDVYAIAAFAARILGTYKFVTAIAADGTLTWGTAQNMPTYDQLATYCLEYRTNKFRIGLRDVGPNMSIGGSGQAFKVAAASSASYNFASLNDIGKIGAFNQFGLKDDNLDDRSSLTWQPFDQRGRDMFPQSEASDVKAGPLLLYLLRLGNSADTVPIARTVVATCAMGVEFIPYPFYAPLFDLRVCIGDDRSIADLLAPALNGMSQAEYGGKPADFSWSGLWEGIKSTASKMWGGAKSVLDTVSKGVEISKKFVGPIGEIGSMASMLLVEHNLKVHEHLLLLERYRRACERGACHTDAYRDPDSQFYVGPVCSPLTEVRKGDAATIPGDVLENLLGFTAFCASEEYHFTHSEFKPEFDEKVADKPVEPTRAITFTALASALASHNERGSGGSSDSSRDDGDEKTATSAFTRLSLSTGQRSEISGGTTSDYLPRTGATAYISTDGRLHASGTNGPRYPEPYPRPAKATDLSPTVAQPKTPR